MIRIIELNVDKNGKISNSGDSFAGVSGETGATSVIFNVNEELLTAIKVQIVNKTLYYRFEVTDALNRHFCLENNEVEENTTFSLPITNAFTVSEGKITISLIFESEGLTLCTLPVDLRIEKGCTGTPDNQQVYSTIVTLFEQAEKQIASELEKSAERCEIAQTKADKILNEATAQAESIKADTVNTANSILSEMNSVCEKATADMNALLEESNTTLTECEQRKNAAEAAALSAIEAANSAAESKTQAEEMLSAKEDVANKETNLKQDVLPDHTKYASAKATQELVSALASSLSEQMYDANARLEVIKADKTALEETTALLAETQQELASAKAEIERLKTAEDFVLVGDITCDGATKNYYLRDLEPLKKIYIVLNTQTPLTESAGSFSIYVNSFSGSGNALVVTEATAKAKHFRLFSERIVNGVWKTDSSKFADAVYNSTWATSYALTDVDYITAFRFTCGDGETKFLPQGTTIMVYGVKA